MHICILTYLLTDVARFLDIATYLTLHRASIPIGLGLISLDLGKLYLLRLVLAVYILGGLHDICSRRTFLTINRCSSTSSGMMTCTYCGRWQDQRMWRYLIRLATQRNLLVNVQTLIIPHDQRMLRPCTHTYWHWIYQSLVTGSSSRARSADDSSLAALTGSTPYDGR